MHVSATYLMAAISVFGLVSGVLGDEIHRMKTATALLPRATGVYGNDKSYKTSDTPVERGVDMLQDI
ncbi:uncharacterized protein K452DRAFT_291849 [Aplosporella prunicola CBS 121167]|uniref:Uncharacterized protein n=1 Tax=Aplosporella prunicola CBS 121167 TaxID=1176127 RepID=A0A6A6B1B7_9PEZI|nr:uncharacterized protein K452DRAFT_291849 [Aplosporella prunicola CBS 121167]KAF2137055.1 hypothetical protein K452DRAFT_291849 [Aplosporella prunicola CBS 121167]